MTTRREQEGWIRNLMGWTDANLVQIALAMEFHELILHGEINTQIDYSNRKAKRRQLAKWLTDEERKKLGDNHLNQPPHPL